MDITAAIVASPGAPFELARVELDAPRPDEILVEIAAVGLCHSDLVARDTFPAGVFPMVFGHEGAGTVIAAGADVRKVVAGDRVALTFRSCGHCTPCARKSPSYCDAMAPLNYGGVRLDGSKTLRRGAQPVSGSFLGQSSFATHALAYERNVVKLPPDLPFHLAAPLGCGIQTGAGGVMNALPCDVESVVLITGAGSVGLAAVMGAAIRGCSRIIVVEPHAARRALALQLGATDAIEAASAADLPAHVLQLVRSGVDCVLDTTGRQDVLEAAMACLGRRGVLGIVGLPANDARPPGSLRKLLSWGQSIRGIIEGDSDPDAFIPELIAHWQSGRLPLEKLVTVFPFAAINEAVVAQKRGDCVKAVLQVTG